jgi:hypothetical protein
MQRLVPLLILLTACASRSELQETTALLEECRGDKGTAQDAMRACEDRYQSEVRQWEDMEQVVSQMIPQTLEGFRAEREQILELVPEQAREEVAAYVDELSDVMGRGFQVLREESEATLLELEIAQTKLDALQAATDSLGATTDAIDSRAAAISETLEGDLREALEAQRRINREAQQLIERIRGFDEQYITHEGSEQRLRLNRRQRELVANFHDVVVSELAAMASSR